MADHDAFAGPLKRRRLEHAIKQQIALLERYERFACLVPLGLHDFKSTNDSLGHAVGDEHGGRHGIAMAGCRRAKNAAAAH